MKYKLIDVKNLVEEDIQIGTCELCEYIGTNYYDILIFQDELGEVYHVENGGWCWGDYFVNWRIDNYVHFADFIHNRNYPSPKKNKYDEYGLETVIDEMYREYEEELEE